MPTLVIAFGERRARITVTEESNPTLLSFLSRANAELNFCDEDEYGLYSYTAVQRTTRKTFPVNVNVRFSRIPKVIDGMEIFISRQFATVQDVKLTCSIVGTRERYSLTAKPGWTIWHALRTLEKEKGMSSS